MKTRNTQIFATLAPNPVNSSAVQCADIFSYLLFFFVSSPEYPLLFVLFHVQECTHSRAGKILFCCVRGNIFEQVALCCKDMNDNYY